MEFLPEVAISRETAHAIPRGLFAVAKVDGVHEREAGLVASFWIEAGGGILLSELERGEPISAAELAAALPSALERELFIKTAILLMYADGKVTDAERQIVSEYARSLDISDGELKRMEDVVKEYLLSHVSHLHNTDATRAVAQKLGV